jgi:hypothetical protein
MKGATVFKKAQMLRRVISKNDVLFDGGFFWSEGSRLSYFKN